jgi:hypothetical protein
MNLMSAAFVRLGYCNVKQIEVAFHSAYSDNAE